jgi:RNA polymerase II-associated factor 1
MHVTVRDPDEQEVYKRATHRLQVDPKFASNMPPEPTVVEEEQPIENEDADKPAEDTRMSDDDE